MRTRPLGRAWKSSPGRLLVLFALLAAASAAPARGDGAGEAEAAFDGALLKDDLAGELADAAKEIRIAFHATAGTKLSATLGSDARALGQTGADGAAGLTLTLCDAQDADLDVDATKYDVSNAKLVRWRAFPLPATGDYTLIVRAAAPGTWRLQLSGVVAATHAEETTTALGVDQTDELEFDGLAGGRATWKLSKATKASKFAGEAVRIVQPDDTDLTGVAETASGSVTLLQDGRHRLVYRNGGSAAGDGKAKVDVKAPKLVRRTAYVRPDETVFVPVVTKVEPSRAFHREDALALTLNGRDFQTGADVRLVRAGRDDIVATDVVVGATAITCVVDLDTKDTTDETSVGSWTVGVWNDPEYATPGDATTLVKESATRSLAKKLTSLSAASITLPSGVVKGAEVWYVDFNDDFADDLAAMGISSTDANVNARAQVLIQAYTILYLRDLFGANETFGTLRKNVSVPICFLVGKPPAVAGAPGVDYNRIEVGGAEQAGDPHDPAEPLAWGASGLPGSEIDFGNTRRDDLVAVDDDGNRVGLGARTAVLDPTLPHSASGWVTATAPLRARPLRTSDLFVFSTNFVPQSQAEADRYAEIVKQCERVSREVAALVAHHVAKAMGAPDGSPTGPLSNPTTSGDLWATLGSPEFSTSELSTMRSAAVPHQLPGQSRQLQITWFPLLPTRVSPLPDCVTPTSYSATFGFVGGRPNAVPGDYKVQFVLGGILPPPQLGLSFNAISGNVPVSSDGNVNNYMCYAAVFRIAVTDNVRGVTRLLRYRLDTYPNVNDPGFPAALRPSAQACINTLPPK